MKTETTIIVIVICMLISYSLGIGQGRTLKQQEIENRANKIVQPVYNETELEYIIFGESQE